MEAEAAYFAKAITGHDRNAFDKAWQLAKEVHQVMSILRTSQILIFSEREPARFLRRRTRYGGQDCDNCNPVSKTLAGCRVYGADTHSSSGLSAVENR